MSAKDKKSEVFSYLNKSNVNVLLQIILFLWTGFLNTSSHLCWCKCVHFERTHKRGNRLLRLHVKQQSAKMREPVLTSLYRSVYMSESHSCVAYASVNTYSAGYWTKVCMELESM